MDGTRDQVKRNQSCMERQVPHHLTHVETKKIVLKEIESQMVVMRDWGD